VGKRPKVPEPTYLFNPATRTWHNTTLARENCNLDALRARVPRRNRVYAAAWADAMIRIANSRLCLRCERAEARQRAETA